MSPLVLILTTASLAALSFAFWKGGPAERLAALCVIGNIVAGAILSRTIGRAGGMTQFVNDGATALTLLVVAVRFASPWMIGVMFFYAAQFSMHAYYMMSRRNNADYLHALINNLNFGGVILCLVIGTLVAWRRRAKGTKAPAA